MKLVVITPVGPGHEGYVWDAIRSVARAAHQGPFSVRHIVIEDHKGELGRAKARNIGMRQEADWFFFLDADDVMLPDALTLNDFNSAATFGAVSLNGEISEANVWPCGWAEIAKYGALGTLSMGFFCRADVARSLRFREDMDAGEDFDFYLRLPSFVKVKPPLVDIGYDKPSAGGPRGYVDIDWVGICNRVIDQRRDAVLASAGSSCA